MEAESNVERYVLVARSVWRRTVGRSEKDPLAEYIFESVAADLATNGIPASEAASLERFEDVVANSEVVDADDQRQFCTTLFTVLQDEAATEDESDLQTGECEICERVIPLTRHHLIPRMLHGRLKKQGYDRETLNRTVKICRLCHDTVHRRYTEKELALEYNTLEKLLQSEEIVRHAKWAHKLPVRSRR